MNAQREWRLLHWRALGALRPAEVALVTGLSERAVRRLAERGELRAERAGGSILVPVSEVQRLIGEESDGTASAPAGRRVREVAAEIVSRLGVEGA